MHDPHLDGVGGLNSPGQAHADHGGGECETLKQRTSFHRLTLSIGVRLFNGVEPGLL